MNTQNRIMVSVSRWDSDNLGDLIADGTVDSDDVSIAAIGQLTPFEQQQWEEELREWEEKILATAPPLGTDVAEDF